MSKKSMIRPRFTLATLMSIVTLAAVVAAAYGMYRRAIFAEDRALSKIGAKGGWVLLYTEGAYIEFVPASRTGPHIADCGTGLVRVYGPSGNAANFQDTDLVLFDDVRTLRSINFKNSHVSATAANEFKLRHPQCHIEY